MGEKEVKKIMPYLGYGEVGEPLFRCRNSFKNEYDEPCGHKADLWCILEGRVCPFLLLGLSSKGSVENNKDIPIDRPILCGICKNPIDNHKSTCIRMISMSLNSDSDNTRIGGASEEPSKSEDFANPQDVSDNGVIRGEEGDGRLGKMLETFGKMKDGETDEV